MPVSSQISLVSIHEHSAEFLPQVKIRKPSANFINTGNKVTQNKPDFSSKKPKRSRAFSTGALRQKPVAKMNKSRSRRGSITSLDHHNFPQGLTAAVRKHSNQAGPRFSTNSTNSNKSSDKSRPSSTQGRNHKHSKKSHRILSGKGSAHGSRYSNFDFISENPADQILIHPYRSTSSLQNLPNPNDVNHFWPEFNLMDLVSESWTVSDPAVANTPAKDKKRPAETNASISDLSKPDYFIDTDPMARMLPDGLVADDWVRLKHIPSMFTTRVEGQKSAETLNSEENVSHPGTPVPTMVEKVPDLVMNFKSEENSSSHQEDFDFSTKNSHLFQQSETLQRIASEISALYLYQNSLTVGKYKRLINSKRKDSCETNETTSGTSVSGDQVTDCQHDLFPQESLTKWNPWSHIFSEAPAGLNVPPAKGKGGAPTGPSAEESKNILDKNCPNLNEAGKYIVRVYYMGKWRKVTVDDSIPVDHQGHVLLPLTHLATATNPTAYIEAWPLLLAKALVKISLLTEESIEEIPMFHPIQCLTGFTPKTIQADYWQIVNPYLPKWELNENNQNLAPVSELVIARQNSDSFLVTQTRDCPLEEPEDPIVIPNWKLIRPTEEIKNLIHEQNKTPFQHLWFEYAGASLKELEVTKPKTSETEIRPESKADSMANVVKTVSSVKSVTSKAGSRKSKRPNLPKTASNLSNSSKNTKTTEKNAGGDETDSKLGLIHEAGASGANSDSSLSLKHVTSKISLNHRRKWMDSKLLDSELNWITIYENISDQNNLIHEYWSAG